MADDLLDGQAASGIVFSYCRRHRQPSLLHITLPHAVNKVCIGWLIARFPKGGSYLTAMINRMHCDVRQRVQNRIGPAFTNRIRICDFVREPNLRQRRQILAPALRKVRKMPSAIIQAYFRPNGSSRLLPLQTGEPQPLRADDVCHRLK